MKPVLRNSDLNTRFVDSAVTNVKNYVTVVLHDDTVMARVVWSSDKSRDIKVEAAVRVKGYYVADIGFEAWGALLALFNKIYLTLSLPGTGGSPGRKVHKAEGGRPLFKKLKRWKDMGFQPQKKGVMAKQVQEREGYVFHFAYARFCKTVVKEKADLLKPPGHAVESAPKFRRVGELEALVEELKHHSEPKANVMEVLPNLLATPKPKPLRA